MSGVEPVALDPKAFEKARAAYVKALYYEKLTHVEGLSAAILAYLVAAKQDGWRAQEGWRLVPIEPTDAMHEAGVDAILRLGRNHAPTLYKAMIAAAPDHPQDNDGWQEMNSAPKDGTPFRAIGWRQSYPITPTNGSWSEPQKFAFATNPCDEQCWHSIPRQSCIREEYASRWRWKPLEVLPAAPDVKE